jgi:hypothetical protein
MSVKPATSTALSGPLEPVKKLDLPVASTPDTLDVPTEGIVLGTGIDVKDEGCNRHFRD